MKIYNKLVRDRIPEIIEKDNCTYDIHIADQKEYTEMLETKLKEETQEYLEDKNLKELADVMEVICSLAKNLGYSEEDLFAERNKRKESRGGFDKKIILERTFDK